jgi:hypothetical protein
MLICILIYNLESSIFNRSWTSAQVRSLFQRMKQRKQCLHSLPGDIEALVGGAKYIRALIPSIVDAFYKKLLQYEVTATKLSSRSTSYQGEIDKTPSESSPQIQYRKLVICPCTLLALG